MIILYWGKFVDQPGTHILLSVALFSLSFTVSLSSEANDSMSYGSAGLPGLKQCFLKILRTPLIDSKESIPPAFVAWRAGTTTLILLGS